MFVVISSYFNGLRHAIVAKPIVSRKFSRLYLLAALLAEVPPLFLAVGGLRDLVLADAVIVGKARDDLAGAVLVLAANRVEIILDDMVENRRLVEHAHYIEILEVVVRHACNLGELDELLFG